MNLSKLHDKLIAVAKKNPPGDHVPYAFEKRIMSRLAAGAPPSPWALWGGPLWRGAVSCVAITVLCGVWTLAVNRHAEPTQESFAQSLDAAVFAPISQHAEDAW
jgi:hypothetical protein